ncbi:MAG: family 43 glycosylhydrolase, partial [Salinivirgaceae bacterium]|nr:family 43 glycosylhydrolase [Salinivirgaceae bacterium]
GKYRFTESTDLKNFKIISQPISMDFHPRHGTIIPVTKAEMDRLIDSYVSIEFLKPYIKENEAVKSNNMVIDTKNKTIFIPVKNGTNLSKFNPLFSSWPGIVITPAGNQDFSKGTVPYTFKLGKNGSITYNVTVQVHNNPVLPEFYADPEIIYSNKTEKFHLYPTSDGFNGWSSNYFESFSSDDLIYWQNDGIILDLTKDVTWANRNAWAPTAIEKEIDGEYKYYYYFTAAQKVGVAVSDNPSGPFTDSGKPLVDFKPAGINGGQEIDPDVFHDPLSDKDLLYWGNGYMAVAELNTDMVSINRSSVKVITPNNTFREGTEVFFRKGKYYFLWSEDDTRSPNYQVRYGISDSPFEIQHIPENNIVIRKETSTKIYGTGHNSVINIPGTDDWYMVYHRFNRPNGYFMGDAAGFHREVCIDKLEFDEKGAIIRTIPTLMGIKPVKTDFSDLE